MKTTENTLNPSSEAEKLLSQFAQLLPVYTHARMTCGKVAKLSKECDCVTHSGPHWLAASDSWRESNRDLIRKHGVTFSALQGYAIEESARCVQLARDMKREGIQSLLTAEDVCAIRAAGESVEESRGIRPAVRKLLCLSLNEAEQWAGGRTLRSYIAIWEWCAVRLGGEAGRKHEIFWEKYGASAYYARINRVRKACGFELLRNCGAN